MKIIHVEKGFDDITCWGNSIPNSNNKSEEENTRRMKKKVKFALRAEATHPMHMGREHFRPVSCHAPRAAHILLQENTTFLVVFSLRVWRKGPKFQSKLNRRCAKEEQYKTKNKSHIYNVVCPIYIEMVKTTNNENQKKNRTSFDPCCWLHLVW